MLKRMPVVQTIASRWALWLGVAVVVPAALVCLVFFRGQPAETQRQLASGVEYRRIVRDSPRPYVAHLVWVDLDNPRIQLLVTPHDYEGQLPFAAMTVGEFLEHYGLLVAINGDYFEPWHNDAPADYYPHRNDPVACLGISVSGGVVTQPRQAGYFARRHATMFVAEDGEISFEYPPANLRHAISGGPILIRDGEVPEFPPSAAHPQTAVGYDSKNRRLLLIVVDGRQPRYSEGLDNHELASLMLQVGCDWALRLDGGGSSTMVARTATGESELLNTPVHSGIPGLQRPVANHLGVYLR